MAPDRPRHVVGLGYVLRVGPLSSTEPVEASTRVVIARRGTFDLVAGGEPRPTVCTAAVIPARTAFGLDARAATTVELFVDDRSDFALRINATAALGAPGAAGWHTAALDIVDFETRRRLEHGEYTAAARRIVGQLERRPRLGDPAVEATMLVVATNLDRKLQLTALAGKLRLLPEQLSRRFHNAIGLPFSSYLVWSRIERLARLIAGGESFSAAARASGLGSTARVLQILHRFFGPAGVVDGIDWTPPDG